MESGTEAAPKGKGKGTVYITEERCKGCQFCVVFCPTDALSMAGRLNAKGYPLPDLTSPEDCNGCDLCGLYCPDFAIYGVRFKKAKKKD